MQERVRKALDLHKQGLNCAQCVAMAYADLVGLDEDLAKEITIGLGFGGGNMEGTCGALAGAELINGMRARQAASDEKNPKGKAYKSNKELIEKFREKTGAVICRQIKGIDTGEVLRSCDGCIQDAAELLGEMFEE